MEQSSRSLGLQYEIPAAAGIAVDEADATSAQPVTSTLLRDAPASNVARSMMKSSSSQIVARILVALSRLVVAGMIVRRYQESLFGEYSLIFGILSIGDWLVDFGTTEVFVRDMCREPEHSQKLLRILTFTKMVQAPVAWAVLSGLIFALQYPSHVLIAGLVGGANVLFLAGVLVYRAIFKATLTMEKESISECVSVLAMIPLVALVCRAGGGLVALIVCHVISRGVFLAGCVILGRRNFAFSVAGVRWHDVTFMFRSSLAIGAVGFLVGGYETMDVLLLSKLGNFTEVAFYSAAQRLVWPTLMALSAVGSTFYPLIASYWPNYRNQFERSCQRALDTVLLLAGVPLSSLLAGAVFYMGLLGHKLVAGAPALRILALLALIKAITGTIGPIMYIVKAQKYALRFIAVALAVKLAAIAAVAHRFGYIGVAVAALVVETLFATLPALYLVQRLTHYRFRWNLVGRAAFGMLLSAGVAAFLISSGNIFAALLAPGIYIAFVFATRTLTFADLAPLLKGKPA